MRSSHDATWASLGMRQSPRGDRLTEPTFGPSGRQERLNWLVWKKRNRMRARRSGDARDGSDHGPDDSSSGLFLFAQ